MDLILVGPGRAGLGLALASVEAGHTIVGVLARNPEASRRAVERVGGLVLSWEDALPRADLLLVAVRDDAVDEVGVRLAGKAQSVDGAVHLSGLIPATALSGLAGPPVGSFHPLQTLPTPELGAGRLRGASIAVTADDDYLSDRLFALAASLGAHPFELDDAAKPLYHAAAAAAANFTLTALAMSRRLFEAAGVDFAVGAPLIRAVIDNALEIGPEGALTGPAARGDVGTIRTQLAAVRRLDAALAEDFAAMVRATARVAGTLDAIDEVLD